MESYFKGGKKPNPYKITTKKPYPVIVHISWNHRISLVGRGPKGSSNTTPNLCIVFISVYFINTHELGKILLTYRYKL